MAELWFWLNNVDVQGTQGKLGHKVRLNDSSKVWIMKTYQGLRTCNGKYTVNQDRIVTENMSLSVMKYGQFYNAISFPNVSLNWCWNKRM